MSNVARNDQQRSAQRQYDSASPADSDERFDDLVAEYLADPATVAEADSLWSGTLDGDQYNEIESALADLHLVDACDLVNSDVMTRLYRLANIANFERFITIEGMVAARILQEAESEANDSAERAGAREAA